MEAREPKEDVVNTPLTDADWGEWQEFVSANFGAQLTSESLASFKTLLTELKDWNSKINLIAPSTDKKIIWRHFADSLAGLKYIEEHKPADSPRIADIGTGAGFPGLPVSIAARYGELTLVESITKKTNFIAHIKEKLGLSLNIINDRVETVGQDKAHRGTYDFVLSRAVSKLSPNLEIALPLLKTGGYALIYKTERSASDEELGLAAKALKALNGEFYEKFCYTIPYEELSYCVVAFRKTGPTPPAYPRRQGTPEKKPL